MEQIQRNRTILSATLGAVFFAFGCGAGSKSQKFESKLQMGRRAVSMLPLADKPIGFQLTQSNETSGIIEMKSHPLSTEVQWINFDPTKQPAIALENLMVHGFSLVDQFEPLTYISKSDLNPLGRINRLSDNLLSVSFERLYMGTTPVRDCYFEVVYWSNQDGTWSLRQINNNTLGRIVIGARTQPQVALSDISDQLTFDKPELVNTRQVVLGEGSLYNQYQFVLATEFTIKNSESGLLYTVTAENGSTRVLEAYGHRLHASLPFAAQVYKRSYKETQKVPKTLAEISVAFSPSTPSIRTSVDGIADPGQSSSATFTLSGSRATLINNTATTPIVISADIKASPTGYLVEPSGPDLTAFNAYTTLLEVNQFARQHLNLDQSSFLSYNLPVFINVASEACNAFFDPSLSPPLGSIALFAAGLSPQRVQCANMADINDVAYHEWGHGLDNSVGLSKSITDGAFSEGIGDIIASYLTDSPQMGEGFFVANNNPIRVVQNTKVYPRDLVNQVHTDGLIIGGAFWDLRSTLIANHGKTKGSYLAASLFFKHLLNTDSYLQSYQNLLLLDDNDGNPTTRSPNYCAINGAFAKHGLAVAENCIDTPDTTPKDPSIAIATQKQEPTGVTLMAVTGLKGAESLIACVGTRLECDRDSKLPRATLTKEGLLGEKVSFVTTTPIPIQAMNTVTMFVMDKDNKLIGSRMFRYVNK